MSMLFRKPKNPDRHRHRHIYASPQGECGFLVEDVRHSSGDVVTFEPFKRPSVRKHPFLRPKSFSDPIGKLIENREFGDTGAR